MQSKTAEYDLLHVTSVKKCQKLHRTVLTNSSAMAERLCEACFIFDERGAFSQNHKIAFLGHADIKKLCSRVSSTECPFYSFLSHPLGVLKGHICDSSLARWKPRSWLPIGYNWIFLPALTAEALWLKIRKNCPLLKGVGHFEIEGLRLPPTSIQSYNPDSRMDLLQLCYWKFSHKETS